MIQFFDVGDRVVMRKPHACGSNEWEITRTGADVKIRCVKCGRLVMLDRLDFIKSAKKNLSRAQTTAPESAQENTSESAPEKAAQEKA